MISSTLPYLPSSAGLSTMSTSSPPLSSSTGTAGLPREYIALASFYSITDLVLTITINNMSGVIVVGYYH